MSLELPLEQSFADRPLSVTEVVESARGLLERHFPVVWVEGEISSFKSHPKGHWFFALIDRTSQLRCVMWGSDAQRVPARPEEGMKVFARGDLSVHIQRGEMRLVVRQLLPTAEGGWHALKLERARQALEKDGLLDPARRRPLPRFPGCVGVVTSPDGAAWHDVVAVVSRRWPACQLVLVGARVQGEDAPRELKRALSLANRCEGLDLLIVGRGGGSKEDLWAFNDEGVARAVAASRAPTISAVGHEIDVTLTDLVADARAATPSAAAEKAVPDRAELLRTVGALQSHLGQAAARRMALADATLARLRGRLRSAALTRWLEARHRVRTAADRMAAACQAGLAARRSRLDRLAAQLDALSPLRVLERGYAVARDEAGRVLRRRAEFAPGARFRLRVVDGEVPSRVEAE